MKGIMKAISLRRERNRCNNQRVIVLEKD